MYSSRGITTNSITVPFNDPYLRYLLIRFIHISCESYENECETCAKSIDCLPLHCVDLGSVKEPGSVTFLNCHVAGVLTPLRVWERARWGTRFLHTALRSNATGTVI